MTFRLTAPHKNALHEKIAAYTIAARSPRVSVSAGKQGGEWVADIVFGDWK